MTVIVEYDDDLEDLIFFDSSDINNIVIYFSLVQKENIGKIYKVDIKLTDEGTEEDPTAKTSTYNQKFEFYEAFIFNNVVEQEEDQ